MKGSFLHNISLALAGTLLAGSGILTSCQASDSEMDELLVPTELDTRAADGALLPGSIPEEMVIDTQNPDDTFPIASLQAATCVGGGSIRYVWHMHTSRGWTEIAHSDVVSLIAHPSMEFATQYRREAVCGNQYVYTNICTVYNKALLDGGAITDTIEMNKTRFSDDVSIASVRPASLASAGYRWEMDKGAGWEACDMQTESLSFKNGAPYRRVTKYRRSVATSLGAAYSNVCTVINYAFGDDPRTGSDMGNIAVQAGPFLGNFTETYVLDTRGDCFGDLDRFTGGGNDGYIRLLLAKDMMVEIKTDSPQMCVLLGIWNEATYQRYYFDTSSTPYGNTGSFPSFEEENLYIRPVLVYLPKGEYRIQVQGSKASNGGPINHLIGIAIRGTGPEANE